MAIEIEKKYRLSPDNVEMVAEKITNAGAKFLGERFEENVIFGGGILDQRAAVLRIRSTEGRSILTYKQRIAAGSDIKKQTEFESEFLDIDGLRSIILSLGFEPRLIYEKHRRIWTLGDAEIVIDELPFGLFMEVEGTLESIRETEQLLEIEDLPTEDETYPRLTAKFGTKRGGIIEARFNSAPNPGP